MAFATMKKMTARPLSNQHGSIAVMAALAISTTVILLASIDIGYLFYQKRELQKVADMAAIAGAQQLAKESSSCASSITAATGNAGNEHQFTASAPARTFSASCGKWDPASMAESPHYAVDTGAEPNAVRIDVSESFGSFFGAWAEQRVNAMAIATIGSPTAVFSVESRLLRIEGDGTVPKLLADLGVDIDGTTLVSGAGMANARVTTSGLLRELGFNIPIDADIATAKEIVSVGSGQCAAGICPLDALLDAIGTVGGQDHLVDVLGITAGQMKLPVKLLTDASGRGLFTILDAANGKSALDADINASEFLSTALAIANSHNAVDAGLVTGIAGVNIESRIGIVEPPSIGIGGKGTTAYTSQVRLFTHVSNTSSPNPLSALIRVNLPLAIDVANGKGTIVDLCQIKDGDGNDTATIRVAAPILTACVGKFSSANVFSKQASCMTGLQEENLLSVLNIPPASPLLSLSTSFSIPDLTNNAIEDITLSKGQTVTIGNELDVASTVSNIFKALTANILGKLVSQGQGNANNQNLASALLHGNSLNSAVKLLNDSLTSLNGFLNGLDSSLREILEGSSNSGISSLLNGVGNLVNGLLTSVGKLLENILGNVGCALSGSYNQCVLEKQLNNSQTSNGNTISNVLLSILGLTENLLNQILNSPGANNLGTQINTLLNSLLTDTLGIHLGQVDVTLIDLHCGGGDNIKLVY